jgi:hypothetical protein
MGLYVKVEENAAIMVRRVTQCYSQPNHITLSHHNSLICTPILTPAMRQLFGLVKGLTLGGVCGFALYKALAGHVESTTAGAEVEAACHVPSTCTSLIYQI